MDQLEEWANSIRGKWLDLDYAPKQHLWQCHDVFLSYIVDCFGLSVGDGHAPGTEYTDQVWRYFPYHRPALATRFVKLDASSIKRGDIVFWWRYGPVGGLPHVAVALADAGAKGVYCVTQNPGAVKFDTLSLSGVLGVLRPIENEDDMFTDQDRELLRQTADKASASYDALFKQSPTSRGTTGGVLHVLGKLEGVVNAIYDAQFKESETSRGTPGGTLVTLRDVLEDLEQIKETLGIVATEGAKK